MHDFKLGRVEFLRHPLWNKRAGIDLESLLVCTVIKSDHMTSDTKIYTPVMTVVLKKTNLSKGYVTVKGAQERNHSLIQLFMPFHVE